MYSKIVSWVLWGLWIPLGLVVSYTSVDPGFKFALVAVSATGAICAGIIDSVTYYNRKRNAS